MFVALWFPNERVTKFLLRYGFLMIA